MKARFLPSSTNRFLDGSDKITNAPALAGLIPKTMMKKITLLGLLMFFYATGVFAQVPQPAAPITYAEKVVVTGFPANIAVNITVDNFVFVEGFTLAFTFDHTVMSWAGLTGLHVDLANKGTISAGYTPGINPDEVRITYSMGLNPTPVSFNTPGVTIFTLNFGNYFGGTSMITWVSTNNSDCEYAGKNLNHDPLDQFSDPSIGLLDAPFGNFYKNGYVTNISTSYAVDTTVCLSPNLATITMTANGGSGNFVYKISDSPLVTNLTGVFNNLPSGTYNLSVSEVNNPLVQIPVASNLIIQNHGFPGRIKNHTTGLFYCYLNDAIANASNNDELHFIFPGNYPGVVFNDGTKSLLIKNTTGQPVVIQGASPALTLNAGTLSFDGVSFVTVTNHPTIHILGGELILRNCSITEVVGFDQAGIFIQNAGKLNAGTTLSSGKNVFVTDGSNGDAIVNTGTVQADALCNYYGDVSLFHVSSRIVGDVVFDPWNDASLNHCIYSQANGPITYAAKVFAPVGNVSVPITVKSFNNVDAITLKLLYDNTKLSFTGISGVNSSLSSASVIPVASGNTLKFTWYADASVIDGVDIPDDQTLFVINFISTTGTHPLVWDNYLTDCEYANALIDGPYLDNPTASFYFDGFISNLSASVPTVTNVTCKGADDGKITVVATGGSGSYIYKVEDVTPVTNTNGLFTDLAPGVYTISVIDATYPWVEYVLPGTVTIAEPTTPLTGAGFESIRVRCKGESNGQATMNASGGWGGILYSIDGINYQVNNYFDALPVGVYTLYAKDLGGCIITDIVNITEPIVALTASGIESKVVTCKGGNDGQATLTGKDGWGGYLYSKDNLNYYLTPTLTGFTVGTYTLYVKDDGGCTIPVSVTITEPFDALAVTATMTKKVSCKDGNDGEITAYPFGGWGTYTFSLNNVTYQTSPLFTGLTAGNYTVYVKDLHGCVVSTYPVVVTEPALLTGVISGDNTVCYGQSSVVTFNFAGGNPPYTVVYKTTTGGNQTISNINASSYSFSQAYTATTTWNLVSLTDAKNCVGVVSGSATITVNPLPVVTAIDITYSADLGANYSSMGGDLATNYTMCIDPVLPHSYLLDVNTMTINPPSGGTLQTGTLNPFILNQASIPAGFFAFWAGKGVDGLATYGDWRDRMWLIINGNAPFFYVLNTGSDIKLVDGLMYHLYGGTPPLTLPGNYPQGLYTYTGTVTDANGCVSLPFDVKMQFNSSPVVADVTLSTSVDQTNWSSVGGDFATGYVMCIDPVIPFHYMDINTFTAGVNSLMTTSFSQNAFMLNTSSLPSNFYSYWAAKGVDGVNNTNGWELTMWSIINGTSPIFYVKYDGTDYTLIDGLQYLVGAVEQPLRISGDYPQGMYTFTGSVTDVNGCASSLFSISLQLNSSPVVTDVTLSTSVDLSNWTSVGGDFTNGYTMCIDPVIPFHYMDINTLTTGVNSLLTTSFSQNAFMLNTSSLPVNFYPYWAAKGVISGASGWQGIMWDIINGTAPMFYIKYDGSDYTLIDGLQYLAGAVEQPLRISGDYPQGLYTFTGSVTDINECTSSPFSIKLQLNSSPVVTDVTLSTSVDQTNWSSVGGDFANGYTMCIDPVMQYHYMDINTFTSGVNALMTTSFSQNAFMLNTSSLPSNFYSYWAAKGVDGINNANGWQLPMWNIINGTAPMFYVKYDGADYTLIDGLQYLAGAVAQPLRISGDYPQGMYTFTGTVTDVNGCVSSPFSIDLQLNSSPVVTDVTLFSSVNQIDWNNVGGDFATGYNMCIDPAVPFYYMDVNTLSVGINTLMTSGFSQNAFMLNTSSLPANFYPYWAAKGVDGINNANGWELTMWSIINGTSPIFYVKYDGTDYTLIDGLQYLAGAVAQPLRISGDYPQGVYTFTGSVTDVNGCASSPFDIKLTLNTIPAITLTDPNPKVCHGATSVDFPYTGTTNNPDLYNITWDVAALANGFSNVTGATLPASPIVVSMTGAAAQGIYTGSLTVVNSVTGCVSQVYSITVNVPAPLSATAVQGPVTCNDANDGTATAIAVNGWGMYTYLWDDPADQTTVTATALHAGWYTVIVTDAEGCTTTATVEVTEPEVLYADIAITNISCYGLTDGRIDITNATGGYGTYEYRLDNGTWQASGAFTGLAAGTYVVEIRDAAHVSCTIILGSRTIIEPAAITVSGNFNYHNLANTPLSNIAVNLMQGTTLIYSDTTSITGSYTFGNVCPGNYEVIPTTSKSTLGAINATDAMWIQLWNESVSTPPSFAGPQIQKVQFYAGDVIPDGNILSGDALAINNNFVYDDVAPYQFSTQWIFWKAGDATTTQIGTPVSAQTISVSSNLTQNFYGLATGDFNRSFTPGAFKTGGSVTISNHNAIHTDGLSEFNLPITVIGNADITAASLILNYPADKIEVLAVTLGNSGSTPVLFNTRNGELRIGHHSTMPLSLNSGEVLFTLRVKALSALSPGETATFVLSSNTLNEIADGNYEVIPNALLNIPAVEGVVGVPQLPFAGQIVFKNYPNPFASNTTFAYTIPADGKVTLEIVDMVGRSIHVVINQMQQAGDYTISMDNANLSAGIYTANLTLTTTAGTISRAIRIVNQH